MTLDLIHIKELTRNIIQQDGIKDYLPTIVLLSDKKISVLDEIPANVSHEKAAKEWAKRNNLSGKEYFLIFKTSEVQIKIEHYKANMLFESDFIHV